MDDSLPEIEYCFETVEALAAELDASIAKGQIYIASATGVEERQRCVVILKLPDNSTYKIEGEAVWARDDGIGVQFEPLSPEKLNELQAFVESDNKNQSKPTDTPALNIHERVRNLNASDQQKFAREGTHPERVALERRYGKMVWETLLRNPRISPPEVAKIARNGTIPKPLIDTIVNNSAWLRNAEVRRALLGNPRCAGDVVLRVLRTLPKNELKMVPNQTAYTMVVRNAARNMLAKTGGNQ